MGLTTNRDARLHLGTRGSILLTKFSNTVACADVCFILPTTAAINKKNDRLLKRIADATTKRGPYRKMRNQITTALLNITR
jgi:hypothetical protein